MQIVPFYYRPYGPGKIFGCWRGLKGSEVPEHRRMALLGQDAVDPLVRNFAVQGLAKLPPKELLFLAPLLVASLKFESRHGSPLARMLLEACFANPLTMGLAVYWRAHCELTVPLQVISRHAF